MNGILCIDKPAGFTSFDVVAKLRGMARTKKIGHGGTLDPMATGVLPLFFGGATKACDLLPNQDKGYTATFRLGVITDTLDITGTVLEQRPVTVGEAEVAHMVAGFVGPSSQLPPMYSAVQVNGHRLYDLARQGLKVERTPRDVVFYSIQLLEERPAPDEYTIEAACSKGTYIRSLCHDIGQSLGCGATLTALRRTLACGYTLTDCITMEEAQALTDTGALDSRILPVETAFRGLTALHLGAKQARLLQNGIRLELSQLPGFSASPGELVAVYGPENAFLGLAFGEEDRLRVKRLFVREVKA